MADVPEDANEHCPGTQDDEAGKTSIARMRATTTPRAQAKHRHAPAVPTRKYARRAKQSR